MTDGKKPWGLHPMFLWHRGLPLHSATDSTLHTNSDHGVFCGFANGLAKPQSN